MLSLSRIANKYARNLSYLGAILQTLKTTEFSWSGNTFILSKNLKCQFGLKTSTLNLNVLHNSNAATSTLNLLQQQQWCYMNNSKCFGTTAMLVNKTLKIRESITSDFNDQSFMLSETYYPKSLQDYNNFQINYRNLYHSYHAYYHYPSWDEWLSSASRGFIVSWRTGTTQQSYSKINR